MIDEFSNLLKNKKNGVIFKQHDIYMYRGVCLFMDKKFEQAINDFERVMVIMPHKDDREDEEEIV